MLARLARTCFASLDFHRKLDDGLRSSSTAWTGFRSASSPRRPCSIFSPAAVRAVQSLAPKCPHLLISSITLLAKVKLATKVLCTMYPYNDETCRQVLYGGKRYALSSVPGSTASRCPFPQVPVFIHYAIPPWTSLLVIMKSIFQLLSAISLLKAGVIEADNNNNNNNNITSSTWPDPEPCSGNCSAIHDPSVVRCADGTWFRFSTNGNIAIASAPSLTGPWEYQGAMLPNGSEIQVIENQEIWVCQLPAQITISTES